MTHDRIKIFANAGLALPAKILMRSWVIPLSGFGEAIVSGSYVRSGPATIVSDSAPG